MNLGPAFSRSFVSLWLRAGAARKFLVVLFTFACVVAPVRAALMPVTTDILNQQRAKWALSGISSYNYEGRAWCFCGPDFVAPHRVVVTDGTVTELLFADTLLPDDEPGHLQYYLPVEALFDFLQFRVDQNWRTVDAMFDPVLGYPSNFFTDYSAQIADDEYWFDIDSLASVPVPGTALLILLSLVGLVGFQCRKQMVLTTYNAGSVNW